MPESVFIKNKKSRNIIIRSSLDLQENYFGNGIQIPYVLINGKDKGPNGVILSGIHGDELNGIPIIHKLIDALNPEHMSGSLLLLPIANIPGFILHSRYLPDRRDLNRLFPGQESGSEGSRIAFSIWKNFIEDADFGLDLHSASYNRWNYPHIRGNMKIEKIRKMSSAFGASITIHSKGVKGSLRREAAMRGIPFILFEAGQINRFEPGITDIGVNGIIGVLSCLEMIEKSSGLNRPEPSSSYFSKSQWIRAGGGGLFVPSIFPGDIVKKGEVLGDIHSIQGEIRDQVKSDIDGRIIGFNLHPQVVPGRALYNIAYTNKSFVEP
ncbi:MAG: succinylglutamate desuccinylase/aspartoacylase family protein [Spirochaetia bacterium]|nr:succinylglutamate desuccinylase/aspartoacylase family protein [Spirochaetia bacterium]